MAWHVLLTMAWHILLLSLVRHILHLSLVRHIIFLVVALLELVHGISARQRHSAIPGAAIAAAWTSMLSLASLALSMVLAVVIFAVMVLAAVVFAVTMFRVSRTTVVRAFTVGIPRRTSMNMVRTTLGVGRIGIVVELDNVDGDVNFFHVNFLDVRCVLCLRSATVTLDHFHDTLVGFFLFDRRLANNSVLRKSVHIVGIEYNVRDDMVLQELPQRLASFLREEVLPEVLRQVFESAVVRSEERHGILRAQRL